MASTAGRRRVPRLLRQIDRLKARLDSVIDCLDAARVRLLEEELQALWAADSEAMDLEQLTPRGRSFIKELTAIREGRAEELWMGRGRRSFSTLRLRNYQRAINYLYRCLEEGRELSEDLVKELHAILFQGIEFRRNVNGQWLSLKPGGLYKTDENRPTNRDPELERLFAQPAEVLEQMQLLFAAYEAARETCHPVELAARFASDFMTVHAFIDGNGRTARMCLNYILISGGFPPAILKMKHREEYLAALWTRSEHGNQEPFVYLVAKEVKASLETLLAALEKASPP